MNKVCDQKQKEQLLGKLILKLYGSFAVSHFTDEDTKAWRGQVTQRSGYTV